MKVCIRCYDQRVWPSILSNLEKENQGLADTYCLTKKFAADTIGLQLSDLETVSPNELPILLERGLVKIITVEEVKHA